MAICTVCDREMTEARSCSATALHRLGEPTQLAPFGQEPGWRVRAGRCPDCGVRVGGFHHLGCDIQRCPACRDQLISCGCPWDEMPSDDDGGEDEDDGWDPRLLAAVTRRRSPIPLPAAAAPLRARHQDELRRLATWSLAHGRPCPLDTAALCLEALQHRRCAEAGGYLLDRPDVMHLLRCDLPNTATFAGPTLLPDDTATVAWSVLSWLADEGRLVAGSAPLPLLLEPLQCYGGLGEDGHQLPDGADVGFACQCYVPHDPTLPPGLGKLILGIDLDRGELLMTPARLHPRASPPGHEDLAPLNAMLRSLRDDGRGLELLPDDFTYLGRVPGDRLGPELWLYRPRQPEGRDPDVLALDDGGTAWTHRRDRRRRQGFRWVRQTEFVALLRAGADVFRRDAPRRAG